jgi:hypothetical protein
VHVQVTSSTGARALLDDEVESTVEVEVEAEPAMSASEVMGDMSTNAAVQGEAELENEKNHPGFARVSSRCPASGLCSSAGEDEKSGARRELRGAATAPSAACVSHVSLGLRLFAPHGTGWRETGCVSTIEVAGAGVHTRVVPTAPSKLRWPVLTSSRTSSQCTDVPIPSVE